jgi:hypothetical protein
MMLDMLSFEQPDYLRHPHYPGLLAAVSHLMASGGYENKAWGLDDPTNPQRLVNMVQRLHKMYPDAFPNRLANRSYDSKQPLSLEQAVAMLMEVAGLEHVPGEALKAALDGKWIRLTFVETVHDAERMTNGELYSLIREFLITRAGAAVE